MREARVGAVDAPAPVGVAVGDMSGIPEFSSETGADLPVVEPSPICPELFAPQHQSVPSVPMAHVWLVPMLKDTHCLLEIVEITLLETPSVYAGAP